MSGVTPNYTDVSHFPVLKGNYDLAVLCLKKPPDTPRARVCLNKDVGTEICPYQESNLYPSTCSVTLRTIHVTANLVLVRENLPQIVTKRHVNSPRISDVSRVHSERSAKRMKVDLAAGSAAAVAALGKFRNDSLLLSNSAGQSPVLKVAVTFSMN